MIFLICIADLLSLGASGHCELKATPRSPLTLVRAIAHKFYGSM